MKCLTLLALISFTFPLLAQEIPETLSLDDTSRASLKPGDVKQFIRLTDGVTHYELVEPVKTCPSPRTVVLVHGVYGPMIVWDKTVETLKAECARVVRFDLYGRGFSDRVKGPYDLKLYLRQLHELITKLGIKGPVDLVGSSMGAIVVTRYALEHEKSVDQVALIGPAGFSLGRTEPNETLAEHSRAYFHAPEKFQEYHNKFEYQLRIKGTKDAIRATQKAVPELVNNLTDYRKLGALGKPVFAAWGKEDNTFPYTRSSELIRALGKVRFLPVDKAGHLPQVERADFLAAPIVNFLLRKS